MISSPKEAWFITASLLVSLSPFFFIVCRVLLQNHRAGGIMDSDSCDMTLNSFSSRNVSWCDTEKIKSNSYITSDRTLLFLPFPFISYLPRKLHCHQRSDILTAPQKLTLYMRPCVKLDRKSSNIVIYFPTPN